MRFNKPAISKSKETGQGHTPTNVANTSCPPHIHFTMTQWVYLCWANLTCPLISEALPRLLGDRFLAKSCPGLKHLQMRSRNTFCKTETFNLKVSSWFSSLLIVIFEVDDFMRFVMASWWCWMMLGGPWCPANQLIDSSNDSCRHSVSCNRQLHHWMTSWEAGAGWLITMGASTSYHQDIH